MCDILDYNCPDLQEVLEITDGNLNKASHLLDIRLEATDQMIKSLSNNIDKISEEEFYQRLMKLKAEHRKTLTLCEQLYLLQSSTTDLMTEEQENEILEKYTSVKGDENDELVRMSVKNIKERLTSMVDDEIMPFQEKRRLSRIEFKRVSSKSSCQTPILSDSDSKTVDEWIDHPIGRTVQDKLKELRQFNREREEAEQVKRENAQTILKRLSAIHIQNVSSKTAQEENPPPQRSHSEEDIADRWRHRITIPQPFSMTIRDELAGGKHKSRSMVQFEKEVAERKRQEEELLKKRFKAKPIPAHVYIPLFDAMMEDQQARREMVKQHRKEILKANEKPFHFTIREHNNLSAKQDNKPLGSQYAERIKKIPKPKPVPKSVKEARLERMMEDELLREVNVKMRAQKLYKSAHAPPGVEKRQQEMEQRLKEKMDELSNNNSNVGPRPTKPKQVPNFKRIHQRRSQNSWSTGEATKPQPFHLYTDTRIRSRPSSAGPTLSSRSSIKSIESTHDWNKSIIAAMEAPLPPTNKSAILRESVTKEKLSSRERKEQEAVEEERAKKRKQNELATTLRKKLDQEDPGKLIEDKVKELANETRRREQDYRESLAEMDKKLRDRELLVEKQAILHSQMKADKKYHDELRKQNLNYDELEAMSQIPLNSNDSQFLHITVGKTDDAMDMVDEMDA